jgi:UDP-galactopyranose mutase
MEKLEYRSIDFNIQIIKNMNYYQPNSVVNYPIKDIPYTRIVEYKHFLNQKSNDTIIVSENTNDVGEPYYPVPNKKNLDLYEKYKALAKEEESKNIFFVGRLANYKYFNMDEAILNSLNFFEDVIKLKCVYK